MTLTTGGKLGVGAVPLSQLDVAGGVAIGSYAGATTAPTNGLIASGDIRTGSNLRVPDDGYLYSSAAIGDAVGSRTAGQRWNTSATPDRWDFEAGSTVRGFYSQFASGTDASLNFSPWRMVLTDSSTYSTTPGTSTYRGVDLSGTISPTAISGAGGPNLLTDPSFESWINSTTAVSWGDRHLSAELQDQNVPRTGSSCAWIYTTGVSDGSILQSRPRSGSTSVTLAYNTTYRFSIYYYGTAGNNGKALFWDVWELAGASSNTVNYSLRSTGIAGAPGSWSAGETVYDQTPGTSPWTLMTGDSSWHQFSVTFTTRAGAGTFPAVIIIANGGSGVCGGAYRVDDAVLQLPSTDITAPLTIRALTEDSISFVPTVSGSGDNFVLTEFTGIYGAPLIAPSIVSGGTATLTAAYGVYGGLRYTAPTGTFILTTGYSGYFAEPEVGTTKWGVYSTGHVGIANTDNTARELRLLEPSSSGVNYTGFKAPALGGNVVYTLPTADGAASSILSTNGSLTLSWITPNLLSATHGDTLADSVQRGDLIYGNATPKWARLAKGSPGGGALYMPLVSNGTDVSYQDWTTLGVQVGSVSNNVVAKGSSVGNAITDSRITDTGNRIEVSNAALTTADSAFKINATFNAAATIMHGLDFVLTNTTSSASSKFFRWRISGASSDTFDMFTNGSIEQRFNNTSSGTAYLQQSYLNGTSISHTEFKLKPSDAGSTGSAAGYRGFFFDLSTLGSMGYTLVEPFTAYSSLVATGTEYSGLSSIVGTEGTWTRMHGVYVRFADGWTGSGGGTITDLHGYRVGVDNDFYYWLGSTVSNIYGLRIDDISGLATSTWGIATEVPIGIKRDQYLFWSAGNTTPLASRDAGITWANASSAIQFDIGTTAELQLSATALFPVTNAGLSFGQNGNGWKDLWLKDTAAAYELKVQTTNTSIAADRVLTIDVNNADRSIVLFGDINSNVYTPTLTGVANINATTAYSCQWMRVGDMVTVSGKITIDPTANTTLTRVGISLPIASNFGAEEDCGGTAATGAAVPVFAAAIKADATNDRAELLFTTGADNSSQDWFFTFTYQII